MVINQFLAVSLPGIPFVNQSAIAVLTNAGVTVGIGPQGTMGDTGLSAWAVRNLRFDAGWVHSSLVLRCVSG